MAHLICYEILMGPIRFFLPGAHSLLKPALSIIYYNYIIIKKNSNKSLAKY